MAELPTGTVTFLFTDLEVSTRLWDLEPDAMGEALARHDAILRDALEAHGGVVVKGRGDGVHAAFVTADAAVRAAIACELAMDAEVWPVSEPLRARVGIHTGVAELRDRDYFGSAVNRAARLEAIAHGGQIVCSQATADLARDVLAEGVAFVDLGEHRLRDLSRPERVFQVSASGLQGQFGPLASVDAFPGKLPLQVSSFIGRERELARIVNALDESRVVTLTGVGGVGKTRLALQVAAELLPRFRYGAWLCELAPVRSPEGVMDAVAALFDVAPRGTQTLEQALVEFLRGKELLLVLDNCEHVLAPAAALVEALERTCPHVTVLATSREGLAIDGERMVAVPSLAAPPVGTDVVDVAAADAVQLFIERAREKKDDFVLTAENADAVAQVCRQLDGVPLALELAAARVPAMNPQDLAARLDRRFQVLAGGRRGTVERHQTLRATIDWSYDLLDSAEQRLLARVTVFSGGWTLEAAEAVCSGAPVEAASVWELTDRLVAQSLVVAEDLGFQTRYRLLETIRQYGEERLADLEDVTASRRRHAEYFIELQPQLGAEMERPGENNAARRLAAEHENLLAAFAFSVDTNDVDVAFRLVVAYPMGAWNLSREFRFPVEAALGLDGAAEHPSYPDVLALSAFFAAFRGDSSLAARRVGEARAVGAGVGGELEDLTAVIVLEAEAVTAFNVGDWLRAADLMERSAEAFKRLDQLYMEAVCLAGAAVFRAVGGDTDRARALATEGLTLARNLGTPGVIARCLSALAGALADSDPDQARTLLRESIDLSRTLDYDNVNDVTQAVLVAGRVRDWQTVLDCAPHAITGLHWLGDRPQLAGILTVAARATVESQPAAAAVLQGISRRLAVFAGTDHTNSQPTDRRGARTSELIGDLRHEAVAHLDAVLGADRRLELRAKGEAMNVDDAIAYALERLDAHRDTKPRH